MLAAVLFDLDCTLVDRLHSIRQYAIRFAEDFRHCLVPTSVERIAEVLIDADGWSYRTAERPHDIAANLAWQAPPALDAVTAHWNRHFPSLTVAGKERFAQFRFQGFDLNAERRLGQSQVGGGPGHAAFPCNDIKAAKVSEFHTC